MLVKPTKLDINCEKFLKHVIISKPSLLQGNNCKVYNEFDTLYFKDTQQSLTTEQFNVTYDVKNSSQDLDKLRNQSIRLSNLIDNKELQVSLILDDIENMLRTIAQHRRTETWTETALGYSALAIGTLYLAHRIGLLDLVKNCIPKKICLFCVKNKVESPTHVITYNASMQPLMPDVPKNKRIKIQGTKFGLNRGSVMIPDDLLSLPVFRECIRRGTGPRWQFSSVSH